MQEQGANLQEVRLQLQEHGADLQEVRLKLLFPGVLRSLREEIIVWLAKSLKKLVGGPGWPDCPIKNDDTFRSSKYFSQCVQVIQSYITQAIDLSKFK